jgi:hypothetical protein
MYPYFSSSTQLKSDNCIRLSPVIVFLVLIYLSILFTSFTFAFSLKIVDKEKVCMVTDKYVGVPQIPVILGFEDFGKKIYYASSDYGAYKLKHDYFIRHTYDPFTRISVSKADAIVAVDGDGKVYYFHSFDTFSLFHSSR